MDLGVEVDTYRYTTSKGIHSKVLITEMCESFIRSEEHLEQADIDPLLEQRQDVQQILEYVTPDQLDRVQKVLSTAKMGQVS